MTQFLLLFLYLCLYSFTAYAGCPSTELQWRDWYREQTKAVSKSPTEASLKKIAQTFDRCEEELKLFPKAETCSAPLLNLARAVRRDNLPGYSMGLSVKDKWYFENPPYAEMFQLPAALATQEFLGWMDREGDWDKGIEFIEKRNSLIADKDLHWITFIYSSQHLATPDGTGTLGRFFVFIPGRDFDRFIQFGLRNSPTDVLPNGLSVVAIQKTDPMTGEDLDNPRAYFKDFWRKRESGKVIVSSRFKEKGSLENCYSCHKTAVLPFTPNPKLFDKKRFGAALEKANDKASQYWEVKVFGLSQSHFGPGLGPVDGSWRTDEFMRECLGTGVEESRISVLRKAMNCQNCHDGQMRGELNYPSAHLELPLTGKSLVEMYLMDHQKMPPNAKLSATERKALFQCLKAEYYEGVLGKPGILSTWLSNDSCW